MVSPLNEEPTSGLSLGSAASRISHSTSTDVSGLMAMPASNPWSWIYRINSFGLVFLSDVSSGLSAAVEKAAS